MMKALYVAVLAALLRLDLQQHPVVLEQELAVPGVEHGALDLVDRPLDSLLDLESHQRRLAESSRARKARVEPGKVARVRTALLLALLACGCDFSRAAPRPFTQPSRVQVAT